MACDTVLQGLINDQDVDAFLAKWDSDWQRYNKTVMRTVQEYEANQG